uniref:Uncharacterized protein n=1 Tax=Labrus bergylta TaxID=56723 RepID=A0A3Q3EZ48_9LABR
QRCYYNTGRKKSKVRLNDQEKMIKIATPKQHPYSSHISQFAMFPSFCSPDDPETGVRATSKLVLNPLIPNRAPDVTLLKKTKGNPYRLEVLDSPVKNNNKAVLWTGEHGFLDPLRGEKQLFYPTPPRTVLPNQRLRDWDLTLSERTSNMLKNVERTHWLTSYQMHYTGEGALTLLGTVKILLVLKLTSYFRNTQEKYSLFENMRFRVSRNVSSLGHSAGTKDLAGTESGIFCRSSEQEKLGRSSVIPHSICNPCILPRPSVQPDFLPEGRLGTLSLLDLQNSFSRTAAHHNFNNSITHAAVNLRDNVATGKKHVFHGINCYYLHG